MANLFRESLVEKSPNGEAIGLRSNVVLIDARHLSSASRLGSLRSLTIAQFALILGSASE
jgi:hypothetical protein